MNSTFVGFARVTTTVCWSPSTPRLWATSVSSSCSVTSAVRLALAATFWEACSSASVSSGVSHSPSSASWPVVSCGSSSRSPSSAALTPPVTSPSAATTQTTPTAPVRSVGRKATTNPAARISAAIAANTAGPVDLERNSMIRLNEYTRMPAPRAARIGNSSGWAMRLRTLSLNSTSADARSLHAWTIHSTAAASRARMPNTNTTG